MRLISLIVWLCWLSWQGWLRLMRWDFFTILDIFSKGIKTAVALEWEAFGRVLDVLGGFTIRHI
jgi:hypothetical protein